MYFWRFAFGSFERYINGNFISGSLRSLSLHLCIYNYISVYAESPFKCDIYQGRKAFTGDFVVFWVQNKLRLKAFA